MLPSKHKETYFTFVENVLSRDAHARGEEGQLPSLPSSMGAGGTRIALHAELCRSLLSCEGAFFDVSDSLVQKLFLGESPQTLKLTWYDY